MAKFLPWEYVEGQNRIRVASGPTPNPKKLTGNRLGAVAGLNKWKSPFEAWCEVCRVGEQPFEGNKFTDAGNVLEPKLIEWCKQEVSPYIYTPEEFFGVEDAKKFTGYDFFKEHSVFGGMWDAIVLDGPLGKGNPIAFIEAKTSSRPQDWTRGVPDNYAVQGLEYCVLGEVDRVFFPVALLENEDYADAELVDVEANTFLYECSVKDWRSADGRSIETIFREASDWWKTHVEGNISPEFDQKRDKAILDVIRSTEVTSEPLEALAKKAAVLEARIDLLKAESDLPALESELNKLKEQLKKGIIERFSPSDEVVTAYGWRVKKTSNETVDKEALKADGLDRYIKVIDSYRLSREREQ